MIQEYNNIDHYFTYFLPSLTIVTHAHSYLWDRPIETSNRVPFKTALISSLLYFSSAQAFTVDVIARTAFGVDVNSQKNPADVFAAHAKAVFNPNMLLFAIMST